MQSASLEKANIQRDIMHRALMKTQTMQSISEKSSCTNQQEGAQSQRQESQQLSSLLRHVDDEMTIFEQRQPKFQCSSDGMTNFEPNSSNSKIEPYPEFVKPSRDVTEFFQS
jgi:hypothetical protein